MEHVRRTKLVCTIGPAMAGRVGELVVAGMDVARLNFSHGSAGERAAAAAAVRAEAERAGRPVALLGDLSGPKIRLGPLAGGSADLAAGSTFELHPGDGSPGDGFGAGVSYPGLASDVRRDDRVLLADGAAELRVADLTGGVVRTEVVRGGTIRSRAGVSIPSGRYSAAALTSKDREDVLVARELGVDYLAQSFVRSPDDVVALRSLIGPDGPPIVAKIETRPAVDAFDAILDVVDAVMVARGDLGVELPYEDVPIIQKQLVRRALERGVPSIVATQMLESMVDAPRPTRAEASDVANAVFDGADAVMLSGETAIGRYPVLAAEAAVRICERCEEADVADVGAASASSAGADAIAYPAVALARSEPGVAAIACYTRTGRTARVLAALRPRIAIHAFSPDPVVVRRLALVNGVVPHEAPVAPVSGARVALLPLMAAAGPRVAPGSPIVLVASTAEPGSGPNAVEIERMPG